MQCFSKDITYITAVFFYAFVLRDYFMIPVSFVRPSSKLKTSCDCITAVFFMLVSNLKQALLATAHKKNQVRISDLVFNFDG